MSPNVSGCRTGPSRLSGLARALPAKIRYLPPLPQRHPQTLEARTVTEDRLGEGPNEVRTAAGNPLLYEVALCPLRPCTESAPRPRLWGSRWWGSRGVLPPVRSGQAVPPVAGRGGVGPSSIGVAGGRGEQLWGAGKLSAARSDQAAPPVVGRQRGGIIFERSCRGGKVSPALLQSSRPFRITFRVAEPEAWARHLRFCSSANAVNGRGLGERNDSDWSRQRGVIRRGIPFPAYRRMEGSPMRNRPSRSGKDKYRLHQSSLEKFHGTKDDNRYCSGSKLFQNFGVKLCNPDQCLRRS
jgi:hypothetical protein